MLLGLAALAMCLFYIAWRYNILFVSDTKVDTCGLIYPRALKQLLVGIYLAELSMIGLFSASVAVGPLVIMVISLVFTILFHITLNNALNPLLRSLPLTLLLDAGAGTGVSNPKKSGSLRTWLHHDYVAFKLLAQESPLLGCKDNPDAYYPPSVTNPIPVLWIPADPAGVSKQEIAQTGGIISITDQECSLDENGKMTLNPTGIRDAEGIVEAKLR